ncbi:UNVERIFIED_CONTAM: hypothetical protein Sradi_6937000 [Sesamum radiatum]|uniref:Reverse transcriptase zinc-binding domain-containing protein n=1 Tax=Sesamum radiatum TaxID=300843 RepID=A0AAW2JIR3_SESRA
MQLSYAARVQLLKSVISALNIYWAMAFILPKGILKVIEARTRKFLWQGASGSGMTRVTWSDVCRPLEEGDQGIWRLQPLNQALMSRHFWVVVRCNGSSVWVNWIIRHYLRHSSIWTARNTIGLWSWRKILNPSCPAARSYSVSVGIHLEAKLHVTINEDGWNWPLITDIEHMEIMEMLPPLAQREAVTWLPRVETFLSMTLTGFSNHLALGWIGVYYYLDLFVFPAIASYYGWQS